MWKTVELEKKLNVVSQAKVGAWKTVVLKEMWMVQAHLERFPKEARTSAAAGLEAISVTWWG